MLTEKSERRHEQCRFGTFAPEAYWIDPETGAENPVALPVCSFKAPCAIPPRAEFALGNALHSDDCEKCRAYQPL